MTQPNGPDFDRLREELEPEWSELREQRVLHRLRARLDADRSPPTAAPVRFPVWMVASAAVAAALLVVWMLPRSPSPTPRRLTDGAAAWIADGAELHVVSASEGVSRWMQTGGEVRYEVDPERTTQLEVVASGVRVRVVGTVFAVRDGAEVEVEVFEGTVEVEHVGGSDTLSAGGSGRFPAGSAAPPPDVASPATTIEASRRELPVPESPSRRQVSRPSPRPETASSSSRSILEPPEAPSPAERDEPRTVEAPKSAPRQTTLDLPERMRPATSGSAPTNDDRAPPDDGSRPMGPEPEKPAAEDFASLVRSADLARATGALDEAAELYARAVRMPAAPGKHALAVFTLAVLEEQRGQHEAAARRFRAYRLRGQGALFEEALAGEARNWRKAGHDEKAADARKRYLETFPNGAYADAL